MSDQHQYRFSHIVSVSRLGVILSILALILSGCTSPFGNSQQSALQITANTQASVYLNGSHVGQTPFFDDELKAGEYTVRLLVDNDPSKDWQTNVSLNPQIVTVINRTFGDRSDESSHYVLQLEPLADDASSSLSIISIPDNVIVKVDGQPKGYSPVSLDDITAGDHVIMLATPGYQEQSIKAQTRQGYKLIVSAELAKTPAAAIPVTQPVEEASDSADPLDPTVETGDAETTPSPTPTAATVRRSSTSSASASATPAKPYVKILETGTGWLRVRSTPSTAGSELAQVDVGTTYPYIESNDTGWYKIEYEPGEEGWIAGTYAQLFR